MNKRTLLLRLRIRDKHELFKVRVKQCFVFKEILMYSAR
jgi:hypothetical protein